MHQVPDLGSRFTSAGPPTASSSASISAATVSASVAEDAMGFLDSLELLPPPPPGAAGDGRRFLEAAGMLPGSQQGLPAPPLGDVEEAAIRQMEPLEPKVGAMAWGAI